MPRPSRLLLTAAAASVVAASILTATAQVRLRVRGGFNPGPVDPTADGQPHDDGTTPVGVTVPDSPGAVERLAHAAEKEQQKQWKVAADFYREAVAQFPDRVVPNPGGKSGGTFRFTGVAGAVQERLSHWPPEGLAVYRNLYGPAAADRLATAGRGDLATLESVFYDDFVTDAGKAAGIRLVDAYAEAGDFPAAAAVGRRLLDLHPVLAGDRPAVLFRTALADHWAGNDAAAHARLGDLQGSDPKAIGTVGGRDVVLADALAAALAVPAPAPAVDPAAADTYPAFGGPGGRGDVSTTTAKPGASLNTIALVPPDVSTLPPILRTNWASQDKVSLANGGATGIMPVVDAGTLFLQDGRAVYAVDADSGMPVSGWLDTYPGDAGGRFRFPSPGRARGELLTVTATPTAVLAVMGQRDRILTNGTLNGANGGGIVFNGAGNDPSTSPVRLVCLDRASGREQWRRSPADLPDTAGAAKTADYDGPVLAVPAATAGTATAAAAGGTDDSVLAVARGGRDGQFDNCYVVCLSARTGQYRWSTYVGSGTRVFDGESFTSQDPSQLALADGRVFVMTNLGTVASLDPADGRVLWLDAYARETRAFDPTVGQPGMGQNGSPANARPWARNPVVVQGGNVFALPTDSKSLMVLDAATGLERKRIDTAGLGGADAGAGNVQEGRGPADVLLGLHAQPATGRDPAGDLLILTDEKHVYGVDWRAYDPAHQAAALRFTEFPGLDAGDGKPAAPVLGRGFLTADSVLVTTGANLHQYGWRRGTVRELATFPAQGTFDGAGGQGPGNVLVTSQNVVVAGPDRVDVYTDLGVVTAKYTREMAAAPADPEPRVRFAAALFSGGRTADALARLDEAARLLGGPKAMRPGPGRQLVFNALLDLARRSARGPVPDPKGVDLATALFDRAADAADGPDQQVQYLLARARFDHDVTGDYPAEVALCQRVLSDAALRQVAVTDEQTAAAAATTAIALAIDRSRSSYAPVEAQAAAALADARTKADPDALLSVAEVYPNSAAAAAARQAAVDQFQASGRPARAIDILRQMYAAPGDPVARAGLLEQVAADFLATGPAGVGPAVDRLAAAGQLAKFNPRLTADFKLPDGTVLSKDRATYADAVAGLRPLLDAADAARVPDLHLSTYKQALAQYAALHGGAHPKTKDLSPFLAGVTPIPDVLAVIHPAPDFARNDRVLTWSPAGLAAYAVGQTTPAFRAAAVTDAPLGAAWVGPAVAPVPTTAPTTGPAAGPAGRWVVWTPSRLAAFTDDGRDAWPAPVAVADLSPAPAVAGGGSGTVVDDAPATPGDADNQQAAINGQVIQVRVNGANRAFIVRGNRLVPAPVAPAAGPPVVLAGGERIMSAQPAGPAGDVLLVVTSAGRLVAVDATAGPAGGRVLWQARPADRPADALAANAHFTVARMDDPGGSTLAVYDTPTGRVVGRRRFGADNTAGQLVNVALGEEGTLAITTANAVEVKDLYEPWKLPPAPLTPKSNSDAAPYTGLTQPDQLLVRGGRVVALYDSGRYVRAYDLAAGGRDATAPLGTGPGAGANVWLRLAGPRLFVVQPAVVYQYNLADPADACTSQYDVNDLPPKFRGMIFGSDYVVAVHDPVDRGPAPSPEVTFVALSRAPFGGTTRMSGTLSFSYRLPVQSGISDWVGVDGGVYVLFGNNKLGLLRGGRP